MFSLTLRLYFLLGLLFGIIYIIVTYIGIAVGVANFYVLLFICVGLIYLQYWIGPKIVEWSMRVRYLSQDQYPQLHRIIADLAQKAGIPKPKVGTANISIPNAFAFGRSLSDGRICVTEGLLNLLDEQELRAVLGHEMSHLKNHDVLTITLLSVIPMVCYFIYLQLFWFGGGRRRSGGGNTALIGIAALLLYFVTNLLVLYGSRIREYFADKGSVELGNRPEWLASALYKLVYGSARLDKAAIKDAEGLKAFFVNDPSQAQKEIQELSQIDIDGSGTIDCHELATLRTRAVRVSFGDKILECLSTHPNMLKRLQQLSRYS